MSSEQFTLKFDGGNIVESKNEPVDYNKHREDIVFGFHFFPHTTIPVMSKLTSLNCSDLQSVVDSLVDENIIEKHSIFHKIKTRYTYTYMLSAVGREVFATCFPNENGQQVLQCKKKRRDLMMKREKNFYIDVDEVLSFLTDNMCSVQVVSSFLESKKITVQNPPRPKGEIQAYANVVLYTLKRWGFAQNMQPNWWKRTIL